ncbi:MAG: TRAP transporter small permease [Georgenia sp.]
MTKVFNSLFRAVEVLMAVFLFMMVALMFLNVVLRFLFSTGFAWSEEVTRLSFIYLVYLGTIGAFRDNQHLGVDTLIDRVPEKAQKVLYTIVQLIIMWTMWLLVQGSWDLAVQNLGDRWVATQYPRALVFGIGVVTGGAILFIAGANLYRLFILKLSVSELIATKDSDVEGVIGAEESQGNG